jgi:hypothetical protein
MSGAININQHKSSVKLNQVKKQVQFNLKPTIYEYEKQKQMSEESSEGDDDHND